MKFFISACTDIGIRKETNQDGLTVKHFDTPKGVMVFAVLCDGMGGLSKGEVASSQVISAFDKWFNESLPALIRTDIDFNTIKIQWNKIIDEQDKKLHEYGKLLGIDLGTTVVALLMTQENYYLMNVGDSRAYEISENITQISNDHSLIAHEIKEGKLTREQARFDKRKNVLLQCVGAGTGVEPEYYSGETKNASVYFLCSDGFIHEITDEEIKAKLEPAKMTDKRILTDSVTELIETDKQRNEKDNISVVAIKTI